MSSNFLKIFHSICKSIKEEPRERGDNKLLSLLHILNSFRRLLIPLLKIYLDNYKVCFHLFHRLVYLFGDDLVNAFDLIDKKRIYLVRSDSGRQVFKVLSKDGANYYICYTHAYYCTCPAFKHKVITSDLVMCKHLTATRIADAMGLVEIENINDQQMAALLKDGGQEAAPDEGEDDNECLKDSWTFKEIQCNGIDIKWRD
uniref:SWIM-type domain-containing protein n=1 Tax=Tetranychus urticae TaxID=32264 RepID=T1KHA1_TETUR